MQDLNLCATSLHEHTSSFAEYLTASCARRFTPIVEQTGGPNWAYPDGYHGEEGGLLGACPLKEIMRACCGPVRSHMGCTEMDLTGVHPQDLPTSNYSRPLHQPRPQMKLQIRVSAAWSWHSSDSHLRRERCRTVCVGTSPVASAGQPTSCSSSPQAPLICCSCC
jgi:hypothetical protein